MELQMKFDRIEDALALMAQGSLAVVVDDEDRQDKGDLILAAEHATPERVGFMVRYSSGVICAALPVAQLDRLNLPLMVARNTESMATAYTITTDYRHGTTTGNSASDRAATLRALVNPKTQPDDFNRPGHVFPLCAKPGGVLARAGYTEAAVDLIGVTMPNQPCAHHPRFAIVCNQRRGPQPRRHNAPNGLGVDLPHRPTSPHLHQPDRRHQSAPGWSRRIALPMRRHSRTYRARLASPFRV
jgi:3,4-dihydroxy-2-butanone 4-phosphate synthase